MAFKMINKRGVSKYILTYHLRIEKALIYALGALIAELENHAKLNAGYKDRTSNLKGSIGGVLLKDGEVVKWSGFDQYGSKGNQDGKDFINTLIGENSKGYVIIIVAGMEYATYVENYHGLNVLKQTELKMRRELPKLLEGMKSKIDRLGI